ncbi:hypothetical protein NKR19_g9205 [Coniochaeta hoffmannii]|uniref:Ubiquitin 3 binding protein But2 C-terminal domain-containing protein n=1 Tax=Coniochaeta hoffmannii TaxID=91930 RepID=A0AA38RBG1_9PEZI|nr:hypothetical protein NKR19_g9205 [Coniochaeta hoffmannii]
MLSRHIIPALTGLLPLAIAATIGPNDTPVPWEISSLTTFSPSGRPGSSPYSILNITITDPNTTAAGPAHRGTAVFPPTTAVCNATFVGEAPPWGRALNCSETSYGHWSFEMLEPAENPSATTNFDVRFTHKLLDEFSDNYERDRGHAASTTLASVSARILDTAYRAFQMYLRDDHATNDIEIACIQAPTRRQPPPARTTVFIE